MKLIVPAFLFLATSMFAQRSGPPGHSDTAMMTTLLSLTPGQQTQMTKARSDAQAAMKTVRASMRTAQTSLTAAIKQNDLATIDTLTAQIGTLHAQELSINSKTEAAFYATLSADQQAKYDTLHKGGFGGPGPGGPHHN